MKEGSVGDAERGDQTHLSSFLRNKATAGLRLTNSEYHVVE